VGGIAHGRARLPGFADKPLSASFKLARLMPRHGSLKAFRPNS